MYNPSLSAQDRPAPFNGLGKRGPTTHDSYVAQGPPQPSSSGVPMSPASGQPVAGAPPLASPLHVNTQQLYGADGQMYPLYASYYPNSPPKDGMVPLYGSADAFGSVTYPAQFQQLQLETPAHPHQQLQQLHHLHQLQHYHPSQAPQSHQSHQGHQEQFSGPFSPPSGPAPTSTGPSGPNADQRQAEAKGEKRRRVAHGIASKGQRPPDAATPLTPRTPISSSSSASSFRGASNSLAYTNNANATSGSAKAAALGFVQPPVRVDVPPKRKLQRPNEIVLPKVVGDSPPKGVCDDDGGHYVFEKGERFAGRYTISRQLGQGTFGKVVEAHDEATGAPCAIKIIRAVPKYRDASKIELRVLTMLKRYDPHMLRQCIRMRECFDYRNHVCLVTDLLDISVYDFLKSNSFLPFPGAHILQFARQLVECVNYIHSLGIVHTDLKPENILLRCARHNPGQFRRASRGPAKTRKELNDCTITLIDFGSAIFDDEYHPSVVSTRHYRAPEIIFGTGWSYPCDMWSIGCVLVEMCTGSVLFQTRDNLEHLHMMEKTLQMRFDSAQLARARVTRAGQPLIDPTWNQLQPLTEDRRLQAVKKQQSLPQLVQGAVPWSRERGFWEGFLDFATRLLTPDPRERMTAPEALEHPWLRGYAG